jgi:hypothetical protein
MIVDYYAIYPFYCQEENGPRFFSAGSIEGRNSGLNFLFAF